MSNASASGRAAHPRGPEPADSAQMLPELKREASPAPAATGTWFQHTGGLGTLANYAGALVVPDSETAPERFKSVPSPWARMLLFEQALFKTDHPAHPRILGEWRGLLGAIAFNGFLPLRIEVQEIDLRGRTGVLDSLRKMSPDPQSARWTRLGLIRSGNEVVGGVSPHTLVFTGIREVTASIPFVHEKRFTDPGEYYAGRGDAQTLTLLWKWIAGTHDQLKAHWNELHDYLGSQPASQGAAGVKRAGKILTLFTDWGHETLRRLEELGGPSPLALELVSSPFAGRFRDHPASKVLPLIQGAHPQNLEAFSRRNDLQMRDGRWTLDPGSTGRVLDANGEKFSGVLTLPRGFTVGLRKGEFVAPIGHEHLGENHTPNLAEFFEPRLIKVADVSDAHARVLEVGGDRFLFPFRPEILAYLTAEQLASYVSVQGDTDRGYTVRLQIPLQEERRLEWERHFGPADVVRDYVAPLLAMWPNFQSQEWKHYFFVTQPQAQERNLVFTPVSLHDGESGTTTVEYTDRADGERWAESDTPFHAWHGRAERFNGLLLGRSLPRAPRKEERWEVSIDFGSTHTRVFRTVRGVGGGTEIIPIEIKPRGVPLLGGAGHLPFHFFVSEENDIGSSTELRSLVKLPLLGRPHHSNPTWLPADGIIYWEPVRGRGSVKGLRANLKWHEDDEDLPAFRSYIAQLYLSIAAEAASQGESIASIITAYPSVFPRHLRKNHQEEWELLNDRYGVKVRKALPEASALASYLVANKGGETTQSLLAIDIGGSTSDLAIWAKGKPCAGDSVQFAGNIISRLVQSDPSAREAIGSAAGHILHGDPFQWQAEGGVNGLIFNAMLRTIGQQFGGTQKLATRLNRNGPGSPGERVIAHAGYLYAAVSYLLGMMVRRAELKQPHYSIYFAGRGSEFLAWVDELQDSGAADLARSFFQAGLGDSQEVPSVSVFLPGMDAKQEVGRGLLEDDITRGEGAGPERVTFLGESGFSNAQGQLGWSAPLTLQTLQQLVRPESPLEPEDLVMLRNFVGAFYTTEVGADIARSLGVREDVVTAELRNRIVDKLFGPGSAWARAQGQANLADTALLESFFIAETKILLEHSTRNYQLFKEV